MSQETYGFIVRWTAGAFITTTAVCVLLVFIFGAFRRTRIVPAVALLYGSLITGLATWILSALQAYVLWGLGWLIAGVLFAGVGVLPVALVASGMARDWENLAALIGMFAITMGFRFGGLWLGSNSSSHSAVPK